jgi:small GTP-binding protein
MATEHKLVVLGAGGVGKSAISIQFVRNQFVRDYNPTIEESYRKQVTIDNVTCMLDILDTAGQEEFGALRHQYMRQGQGFLLVFSVTDRSSFEEIQSFYNEVFRVKEDEQPKNHKIPIIVVGNKADLESSRVVRSDEGQDTSKKLGCQYIETSAKTRQGVEEAYFSVVRKIRETAPKTARGLPWDESKRTKHCIIL